MANAILKKFGNDIAGLTLIPSGGGVFKVTLNDKLTFSKKQQGRFPEDDEIFTMILERIE